MPVYDYSCGACGTLFEVTARFADYKPKASCVCGGVADRVFTPNVNICVKGMSEFKFDPRKNVTPGFNRDAKRSERAIAKVVETQHKLIKERRAAGKEKEDGWEHLGFLPAPLADSMAKHEGDKEAVYKDPIPFMKATGTYVGRD